MPTGVYKRTEEFRKRLGENPLKIRKPNEKMLLTEGEVFSLYYGEKKSLEEIGKLGGVCRARVAQLMEEWGYPRCKRGRKHKRFTDLIAYLEHSKETGKQTHEILMRLVKPYMKQCETCGSPEKLHIKYLQCPAISFKDFKILCNACLYASCRKGIDGIKKKEICSKYIEGKAVEALTREYGVTTGRIYQILWEGGRV